MRQSNIIKAPATTSQAITGTAFIFPKPLLLLLSRIEVLLTALPQSEIVFFLPVLLDQILECIDQQYSFPFAESLTIHNNITILLNGNILPVKCIFISFHETPFSIGIFQNRSCQYSIFHSKTQICKFTLACIYHIIAMGL